MRAALVFLALALLAGVQAPAPVFRAGAATSNLTPWLGVSINGGMQDHRAEHVHDELHARCLVLDDGRTKLAFAVVDSCMLPREVTDEARRRAAELAGIPADHILISATHTHSAGASTPVFQSDPDPEYPRFVARRVADGIRRAATNLRPARIGWGAGRVPEHVFNRRWRMKPGTVPPNPFGGADQVKMNPPAGSPDLVEPAGPTDPEVSVVSVVGQDGRAIALLANYSLHYVGGVPRGVISADYYGMFADRVQQLLGADRVEPPFVALMSNGTSGNINNVDFRQKRPAQPPFEQMRRVADRVAEEAHHVTQGIVYRDRAELGARTREIELGVRLPDAEALRRANEILAKAGPGPYREVEAIYAREAVLLARYPARVPALLQVLRIGDLGIAAIPAEVFVEIGLELRRRSPFPSTFTVSLANGYNGYLPTAEHHGLGGYETWRARSSYLEVAAAEKISRALLELFGELRR